MIELILTEGTERKTLWNGDRKDSALHKLHHDMLHAVRMGLEKEGLNLLLRLEHAICAEGLDSPSMLKRAGMDMALAWYGAAQRNDMGQESPEWVELRQVYCDFFERVPSIHTVKGLVSELARLLQSTVFQVRSRRLRQMKDTIQAAIDYMEKHYDKDGLTLKEVSRAVHISPTYLSYMFKKEKKIKFSQYLFQIRMKAAMDMLKQQGLNASEIGRRVGYPNSQYFSVCFKKYTGMSPGDFRNLMKPFI